MRALGATEGMAFDGGGSSTIVVRRLGDALRGRRELAVGRHRTPRRRRPLRLQHRAGRAGGPPGRAAGRRSRDRRRRDPAARCGRRCRESRRGERAPLQATSCPRRSARSATATFVALHAGHGRLALRAGRSQRRRADRGRCDAGAQQDHARPTERRPERDDRARGARLRRARLRARASAALALERDRGLDRRPRGAFTPARTTQTSRFASARRSRARASRSDRTTCACRSRRRAHFVTPPRGGRGALTKECGLRELRSPDILFADGERAAYARADIPLPPDTIGIAFDLQDDGSAARVRVAVRNEINEDTLLDATQLGPPGWRNVSVRFAPDTRAPGSWRSTCCRREGSSSPRAASS